MAVAYVRENAAGVGVGRTTTYAKAITTNATPGDVLVALFGSILTGSGNGVTFSDTRGNTWTTDTERLGSNYICVGSTSMDVGLLTTADTVTVTGATAFTENQALQIVEFSGVDQANRVAAASSVSHGGGTTTNTGALSPGVEGAGAIALLYNDPNASNPTINVAGTVGTYSNFSTTNQSTGNRNLRGCYRAIGAGTPVAQQHNWSWVSSSSAFVGTSFVMLRPGPISRPTLFGTVS